MKREIKFRGKRTVNGEWIYGMPTYDFRYIFNGEQLDSVDNYEVTPETVGQFTGFTAAKHKSTVDAEIYEYYIFRGSNYYGEDAYFVVMWINQRGAFYLIPIEHYTVIKDNDVSNEPEFEWLFRDACLYDFSISIGLTKVGNIHDNPELLM